jgi:hypothetical protein
MQWYVGGRLLFGYNKEDDGALLYICVYICVYICWQWSLATQKGVKENMVSTPSIAKVSGHRASMDGAYSTIWTALGLTLQHQNHVHRYDIVQNEMVDRHFLVI